MKAIAIVLACASWACAAESAVKAFPAAGGERVEVTVTKNDPELCVVITERRGKTLILKAEDKSRSWFRRKGCEAGFTVKAPAALRVSANAAAGDLRVAGIKGALTLGTGAGSIALDGVHGDLAARTGAGDVTGTLSSSRAMVSTGAGSIELAWKTSPAKGKVKADAGAGSVRLAFPNGTELEAVLSAGVGSASNEFGDTKGAGLRVTAASGVGDVVLARAAKDI